MNVYEEAIRNLRAEAKRLDQAIATLESLQEELQNPTLKLVARRGRKSMGAEERKEVSARMKKYWASQRKLRAQQ